MSIQNFYCNTEATNNVANYSKSFSYGSMSSCQKWALSNHQTAEQNGRAYNFFNYSCKNHLLSLNNMRNCKNLPHSKSLSRWSISSVAIKMTKPWGGDWQITAEGAFFLCNLRFMSKLYNATDNKGLHTTLTPQRIHGRLSPYIRLLLQRWFNASLPFKAMISFKAQRLTSWPQRDLRKRLRTRASESSRRTTISSALDLNKSCLKQKAKEREQQLWVSTQCLSPQVRAWS